MKHLVITSILVVTTGLASADDTAESTLKRAQALYKAGRIHQACEAFEASDKLAQSVDTEISLASCYEQDGRPASAARLLRATADKDSHAERKKASLAKAGKLEARAPKLRFAINPMPAGLVVKVDGVEVPATQDALVDTGPHEVTATAPGFEGHASAPVDRERAIVDVIVRMEPHAEAPAPKPAAPVPPPSAAPAPAPSPVVTTPEPMATVAPSDHRKRNGYIIGGVGVGMLVAAGVLYAEGSSKFDDEQALCPQSMCRSTADLQRAKSLVSDSRTYSGVGIGVGIGGLVAIGVGAYFVFAPHAEERHVTAQIDRTGATVGYTTRF